MQREQREQIKLLSFLLQCCALPAHPLTICSQRLNLILNLDQVLVLQAGRVWCWTHYCPAQPSLLLSQQQIKGSQQGFPPLSLRALSPIPHAMGFSSPSVPQLGQHRGADCGFTLSSVAPALLISPERKMASWFPLGKPLLSGQRLPQNQAFALPFFVADTQGGVSETGAHLHFHIEGP